MFWKIVESEGGVSSNLLVWSWWLSKMTQSELGFERSCERCVWSMGCVGIGGFLWKVMFLNGEEDEEGLSVMLGGIWKKKLWLLKVGNEAMAMKS